MQDQKLLLILPASTAGKIYENFAKRKRLVLYRNKEKKKSKSNEKEAIIESQRKSRNF